MHRRRVCPFVGVELQQEGTGIIQGALVHWGTGALSVFTCFFVIPSWESHFSFILYDYVTQQEAVNCILASTFEIIHATFVRSMFICYACIPHFASESRDPGILRTQGGISRVIIGAL